MAGVDLGTPECDGRVVVALQQAQHLAEWSTFGLYCGYFGCCFHVGLARGGQQPGRHRPRSARMMSVAAMTPRRPVADRLGTGQ